MCSTRLGLPLAALVQGYLGGDVPDLRRALAAATAQGAQVSRDDFAFPDWQPGQDYAYS